MSNLSENTIQIGGKAVNARDVNNSGCVELRRFKANVPHKRNSLGEVFLVGAGPGDPELLTLKAYKLLQSAEIVLYDALISDEILAMVNSSARMIHVGKRASCHYVTQEQTNQLLVDFALKGYKVVRLKGGDPFIFGRGGEELQVLAHEDIPFQVVPGITAASGCASYAGIPLTHRDFSQSIIMVTAHRKEQNSINWKSLAESDRTLVFYMGLMKNSLISSGLIEGGLQSNIPVAIIENGTKENQRVITGELANLSGLVEQHQLKTPALIVVGEVVKLADELSWFQKTTRQTAQPQNRSMDSKDLGFAYA